MSLCWGPSIAMSLSVSSLFFLVCDAVRLVIRTEQRIHTFTIRHTAIHTPKKEEEGEVETQPSHWEPRIVVSIVRKPQHNLFRAVQSVFSLRIGRVCAFFRCSIVFCLLLKCLAKIAKTHYLHIFHSVVLSTDSPFYAKTMEAELRQMIARKTAESPPSSLANGVSTL